MSGGYLISPRGVERLRGLLRGSAGATSPTYVPAAVSFDDFAAPFTVEWHASEDGGDGAWCIWLPDAAKLVMRGAAYVTPTGITAATELPSGWYTMYDVEADDDEVWLSVKKSQQPEPEEEEVEEEEAEEGEGDDTPAPTITAEITNAPIAAVTGEEVVNILIAKMEVDDDTGARRVKQFVDSAVVIGTASDGVTPDDVSTEFIPHDDSEGAENTHEGELQIKGWNKGTPASASTLTENIFSAGTNQYGIVARRTDAGHVGELVYIQPGSLNIDSNPLVVMSVDYVTRASDGGDFATHPYAIRIKRGHLSYDAQNNILTVVEDVASKTFIDTRPLTQELS